MKRINGRASAAHVVVQVVKIRLHLFVLQDHQGIKKDDALFEHLFLQEIQKPFQNLLVKQWLWLVDAILGLNKWTVYVLFEDLISSYELFLTKSLFKDQTKLL